jgi:Holliday junction resolvase
VSNKSKRKGTAFEREIVRLFEERGISAIRAWGSDGRSIGLPTEVDIVIDIDGWKTTLQCKRRKKIAGYILPEDNVYAQVIRGDRGEAHIVIRLKDFIELIT